MFFVVGVVEVVEVLTDTTNTICGSIALNICFFFAGELCKVGKHSGGRKSVVCAGEEGHGRAPANHHDDGKHDAGTGTVRASHSRRARCRGDGGGGAGTEEQGVGGG